MTTRDSLLLEQAYKFVKLLTETPEIINNKYDRNNYYFEYFMGDKNGVLIHEFIPTIESHAFFLKKLKTRKVIDDNYNIIYPDIKKEVDSILGKPASVDFNFSGVILPKQKDVDSTYISFWTKACFESNNRLVSKLLLNYAKRKFNGPFVYEITKSKEQGEFQNKIIRIK
jgi:hypothetical protein